MESSTTSTTGVTIGETSGHKTAMSITMIGNDVEIINSPDTHHTDSSNNAGGHFRVWQETVSPLDKSGESPQKNIATIGNISSESAQPRETDNHNDPSKDTSETLVEQSYIEDVATNPPAEPDHNSDNVNITGNALRYYVMAERSTTSSTAAQDSDEYSQASQETSQSHETSQVEMMSNTKKQADNTYNDVIDPDIVNSDGDIRHSALSAISETMSLFTGGEPGPDVGPWKRVSGRETPMNYGKNSIMASFGRPGSPMSIREFVARQDMDDCVVNRVVPPPADLPSHVVVRGSAPGEARLARSNTVNGWGQRDASEVPGNSFGRIQAFPSIIVPDQNWTDLRPAPAFYVHRSNPNQSSTRPYDSYKTSLWIPASHHQKLDRPIFIANPLDYIIYDDTCKHCEVNCCPCLNPTLGLASDPHAGTGDGRIITEGFCRHCVLAHCRCVVEPQWGQRHAKAAEREARNNPAPRLLSDTGTVRRYDVPDAAVGSSSTEPGAEPSIPEPAHIPTSDDLGSTSEVSGAENNGIVITIADPARDLEAQYSDDDTHSVSVFRMSRSERATRRTRFAPPNHGPVSRCLCRSYLVSCIMAFSIIVGVTIWVSIGHGSATN